MSLASILTVTLDRYDLAVQSLVPSLRRAGYPFEFLSTDNGSTDYRVVDLVAERKPVYHRLNGTNEGYARAMNQMLLRAKGDYVCLLDPDIEVKTHGWLARLVEAHQAIPETGVAGIHCVLGHGDEVTKGGIRILEQWHCFGIKCWSRALIDQIGYLNETFGLYGQEDVDWNFRVNRVGRINYYRADLVAIHHGNDCGDQTPYRKMKWAALAAAEAPCNAAMRDYDERHNYFLAGPELR